MSFFTRKRRVTDLADLEYEQAKRKAYAREVLEIARRKGQAAGEARAKERWEHPQGGSSFNMNTLVARAKLIGEASENMLGVPKKEKKE